MKELPRGARWYISAVSLLGLAFLVYFTLDPVARRIEPWHLAVFLVFSFLSKLRAIPLSGGNSVTIAGVMYFATFLLFGVTPTLWIIVTTSILSEIWQRRTWYRIVFNTAQIVVSFSLAGFIFEALAHGRLSLRDHQNLLALSLTILVIFVANTSLLSGVVSLAQNIRFSKVWRDQWGGIVFTSLINFPMGILVALIYLQEPLAVLVLVIPFAAMQYAFHVHSTNRELDKKIQELSLLFEASHYLGTSLSLRRALQVLLDVVQRIIPCERAHVYLFEPGGKSHLSLKATSYTAVDPGKLEWDHTDGTILLTTQKGHGMIIHDAVLQRWLSFPMWNDDQRKIVQALYDRQQSAMNVPLQFGDSPLGFVEITSSAVGIYTEDDLKLLSTLANVAAVAIKNAFLYENTLDLATKDGLTGLYNHRLLQELLEKEVARSQRESLECTFILFDIDLFKNFNDTYGHMTGDLILREVAKLSERCVRDGDIVGRYGGEEFGIILPHTSKGLAIEVGERLRKGVENAEFPFLPGKSGLTISLGMASFPYDARDKVSLIEAADSALYHAKSLGRNRTIPYTRKIKGRTGEYRVLGVERLQSFLTLQVARMLANFLDVREGNPPGRTARIAAWVAKLSRRVGLPPEEVATYRIAALLHDLGKIAVGRSLLKKQGPLSAEERELIRMHPEIGGVLVGQFPLFQRVAALIYQNREHYDGTGYPLGLSGDDILLGARILAVVDAYFSMVENHAFKPRKSPEEALAELERESGRQFDPEIVQKFEQLLHEEALQKV